MQAPIPYPMVENTTTAKGSHRLVVAVALIALVAVSAASVVLIMQDNNTIANLNAKNDLLTGQLYSTRVNLIATSRDLNQAKQNISALEKVKVGLEAQIEALRLNVTKLSAENSNLSKYVAFQKDLIGRLEIQLSTDNAAISQLNQQVSSLESQVSSLESTISLSQSTVELSTTTLSIGPPQTITSFVAQYAGFVVVHVTYSSNPSDLGLQLVNDFSPPMSNYMSFLYIPGVNYYYYLYSTSGSFIPTYVLPVLPGTVDINLATFSGAYQTVTVSVTYYY
jgi:prefoldin subunit 5